MFHFVKQYLNGRATHSVVNPTSLGNVLIGMGLVYAEAVERVLAIQRKFKDQQGREEFLIGELLVREGYITHDQLTVALLKQRQLRGEKLDYKKASDMVYESLKRRIDETPQKLEELTKMATEAVNARRK